MSDDPRQDDNEEEEVEFYDYYKHKTRKEVVPDYDGDLCPPSEESLSGKQEN